MLSAQQWQWDIYNGCHQEPMNGNPGKVLTEGDAWNDEDLSAVGLDASGAPVLRQDARLIDRRYPSAVAGRTLAFTYEDRSRDAGRTLTWDRIPASMPHVAELVGSGQYGVLVWRSGDGTAAPTELRLPRAFHPETTVVVSDLGTVTGPPAYEARGHRAEHRIATADAERHSRRLLLTAPTGSAADADTSTTRW